MKIYSKKGREFNEQEFCISSFYLVFLFFKYIFLSIEEDTFWSLKKRFIQNLYTTY